ncbi:MAG: ATP-dependent RecD-like DNA helicase [Clostridia bacterium]|nr:ATP-dependent RecD-like DNA helicase [Clostridia bacterium]
MPEMKELCGVISSVVYANEENGYTVLEVDCDDGLSITLVGTVPMAAPGEHIRAEGRITVHPSYGPQFQADRVERTLPDTAAGILKYLAFGGVKGIGPATAQKIVAKFGERSLEIIRTEPLRLTAIGGITEKRARAIGAAFTSRFALRALIEFLSKCGLDTALAAGLYKKFGEAAPDRLCENPYMLCEEPWNSDFFQVDRLAGEMGFAPDCYERVVAAVFFELSFNAGEGHCFLPREKLVDAAAQLLGLSVDIAAEALEDLISDGRLRCEPMGKVEAVYLPALYEAETFCAQRLAFLAGRKFRDIPNAEALLGLAEKRLGLTYASKQREAVLTAASGGITVLTGGPGTGKTTIIQAMLALFQYTGSEVALAAPTGRAAKRLGEVCGREARTIHRLLEVTYDEAGLKFIHNEKNPLTADVIIVDEMSMVDVGLFAALLSAIKNSARLILVGDADQLPSVGPGSILRDILDSGALPSVRLTEIFRQAQESAIVINAHRINRGEELPLDNKQTDFFFLRRNDTDSALQTVVDLVRERLPRRMGFDPTQIQVLSPARKSGVGTFGLNAALQEALNPPAKGKKERQMAGYILREGDRVMQVQNNYDLEWTRADGSETGLGVFNGDIGILRSISPATESATVVFDDREAVYDFETLRQLELAYAATVHKSQGSEFPVVVLAACMGPSRLLYRSLLYTAVTRAKKLLIIVGREEVLRTMIASVGHERRYSGLKLRLRRLTEEKL